MSQKPSIPKGTRDFGPVPMMRRNYLFTTIRNVFERYGYQPIETPAMESLDTLLGKYGEEGDRLIFKILNSGDYTGNIPPDMLKEVGKDVEGMTGLSRKLTGFISEKALRYDLTVPFARYVVQHRDEITLPFKRYQIQPVWRADRPQKGRYREFYQCDVDVIGSDSLLNEAELIRIIDDIFSCLDIPVTVKINNRKILAGIAEAIGQPDKLTDLTVALDKLEKVGIDEVSREWKSRGISDPSVNFLRPLLGASGDNQDKITMLKEFLKDSETGSKGLEEVSEVLNFLALIRMKSFVEFDVTLARGLNYYTGAIIEVKAIDFQIGSICGGGRYDDLTGIFGMPGISGVGVSFGADRIYDVLEQTIGFPAIAQTGTQVLVANFGPEHLDSSLKISGDLRNAGIRVELYPDPVKIRKQFQYADSNSIPVVVMIGGNEKTTGSATVKNMLSGEQISIEMVNLVSQIRDIVG